MSVQIQSIEEIKLDFAECNFCGGLFRKKKMIKGYFSFEDKKKEQGKISCYHCAKHQSFITSRALIG